MFDNLSEKFEQTIKRLRGHGKITERNIDEALREVRLALLEADVNFQVVKDFLERVRAQAVGQEVLASLTPEQHFIKIVNTELAQLMGGRAVALDLNGVPPVVLMLVGLNGAGKTTTVAKLARHLKQQGRPAPYLVPADVYRPAAIQQLVTLAGQIGCPVHPSHAEGDPVVLCREAVAAAHQQGHQLVIIDTAGRLHIDDELMAELERIKAAVQPYRTLLVVDAMTGQDAVNAATGFHQRIGIDGVILTKLDGDARGGAALSVRAVTGAPILFAGMGEKLEALEVFHPDRMATRVLGMGDILTLIEKAQQVYDQKQAAALQQKLRRDEFTLDDFRDQIRALRQMGNMTDLLKMIPGMKKLVHGVDMSQAEGELRHIEAIISSMTKEERRNHAILNGSRRKRIALGSGTSVAEVNRFLKQFVETKKVMKHMSKFARAGAPPGLPRGFMQ
ncbi:MAG: signal recognition particle protein [Deltaproteobacteria bacterium]|nr:signal recognition particle protein [Deltaproteobacteria bacterium]